MSTNWLFKQVMNLQISMYRRSGGKTMGRMRGMPLLLLTTVGRKSGEERVTPVMYLSDSDNYVVTASNNGADKNPAWFANLMANPHVKVEVGDKTFNAVAGKATAEEKSRLWPLLVAKAPFFAEYQKKTTRDIPMVILAPQKTEEYPGDPEKKEQKK